MAEGSLYEPGLAACAIQQSWGDWVEGSTSPRTSSMIKRHTLECMLVIGDRVLPLQKMHLTTIWSFSFDMPQFTYFAYFEG